MLDIVNVLLFFIFGLMVGYAYHRDFGKPNWDEEIN